MAMSKWIVVVVVVVTVASLGHSRKELGSPGANTRRTRPRVAQRKETQSVKVPTGDDTTTNSTTNLEHDELRNNITEIANTTSTAGDAGETDGGGGGGGEIEEEENQETTALVSDPPIEDETTIFSWIYDRIIYAIESYSKSDSLWDWLTGLGGGRETFSNSVAASRLYDLKFSPLAYEIIEFLEPYGFKPYPDPYEPLYLDKDDIWKFTLNWLFTFGLISLFWRSYDLPLPYWMYEKFGFLTGPPGEDIYDYYDEYEEEEEEEEDEEDDPYGDDDDEEEEEEEEYDPYGEDDEEEEEDDEDNYYKVGEEEKEREHESFAVFRQKNPDDDDDDDDNDDEIKYEVDAMDHAFGGETDEHHREPDSGGVGGTSSYTSYSIPGGHEDTHGNREETGDIWTTAEDERLAAHGNKIEQHGSSSYTSYTTSDTTREAEQTHTLEGSPSQTILSVRRPPKKVTGSRHKPLAATSNNHRRPPFRPSQGSLPLRSSPGSKVQRPPPPGIIALLNKAKVAGKRPAFPRKPPQKRPGNGLRWLTPRPSPGPPPSSASSSFFPLSLFE